MYAQQLTHLSNSSRIIYTVQEFMANLVDLITTWTSEGDQIIIMGDLNKYFYSHKLRIHLSKLGLRELVIEQHGPEGPTITKPNNKNYAIYGIWGSPGLSIIEGGYLDFNQGPKYDHRKICIKLSTTTAFGNRYLISKYSSSQKLRLLHPTGQHTYMSKIRQLT